MKPTKENTFFKTRLLEIVLNELEHGQKWRMICERTSWILENTPDGEGKVLEFKLKEKGE